MRFRVVSPESLSPGRARPELLRQKTLDAPLGTIKKKACPQAAIATRFPATKLCREDRSKRIRSAPPAEERGRPRRTALRDLAEPRMQYPRPIAARHSTAKCLSFLAQSQNIVCPRPRESFVPRGTRSRRAAVRARSQLGFLPEAVPWKMREAESGCLLPLLE